MEFIKKANVITHIVREVKPGKLTTDLDEATKGEAFSELTADLRKFLHSLELWRTSVEKIPEQARRLRERLEGFEIDDEWAEVGEVGESEAERERDEYDFLQTIYDYD